MALIVCGMSYPSLQEQLLLFRQQLQLLEVNIITIHKQRYIQNLFIFFTSKTNVNSTQLPFLTGAGGLSLASAFEIIKKLHSMHILKS